MSSPHLTISWSLEKIVSSSNDQSVLVFLQLSKASYMLIFKMFDDKQQPCLLRSFVILNDSNILFPLLN